MLSKNTFDDLVFDDAPAGGVVLVHEHGRLTDYYATGQARADTPWTAETLALNYSVGKGILAMLVHRLAFLGHLDLTAPIALAWSDFGQNGKTNITWLDVLHHRAGLYDLSSITTMHDDLTDWATMCARVAAMPPSPTPNSAYSALVYGWVLGGAIEALLGQDLQSVLDEYLCAPLNLVGQIYAKLPTDKFDKIALPHRLFDPNHPKPRKKPTLKPDSQTVSAALGALPAADIWRQHTIDLNTRAISALYFDMSQFDVRYYQKALLANSPFDYFAHLGAVLPAANMVASANALATIYQILANGGKFNDMPFIDANFLPTDSGIDHVIPARMRWRAGFHQIFNLHGVDAFGHMGYHGAVAGCAPDLRLSFVFLHNFDATMLHDIRQFALIEEIFERALQLK